MQDSHLALNSRSDQEKHRNMGLFRGRWDSNKCLHLFLSKLEMSLNNIVIWVGTCCVCGIGKIWENNSHPGLESGRGGPAIKWVVPEKFGGIGGEVGVVHEDGVGG